MLFFNTIKLYYFTISKLRLIQIIYQIKRKLFTARVKLFQGSIQIRPIQNELKHIIRKSQSIFEGNTFIINNEAGKLADVGWSGQERSELWRYKQHYFDDLCSVASHLMRDKHSILIDHWIKFNKQFEKPGWDPYPTSLRIVNWIKWDLTVGTLSDSQRLNLFNQARWLHKNIEYHILGNHIFANAKALIFAGIYFQGTEAEKWLSKGTKILLIEIREQVLDDGGHFELSPMYHSIFVEDILDLINLFSSYKDSLGVSEVQVSTLLRSIVPNMLSWLHKMIHPDGAFTFFNDSNFNSSASYGELREYAKAVGIDGNLENFKFFADLEDSGFFVWRDGGDYMALDSGEIGPKYLPGHAHADTLSFELSIFSSRIIVNSGLSCYAKGALRAYQRSTKAHSTIALADSDSSEVWSSFRVARRASIIDRYVYHSDDEYHFGGTHDGYRRLPCRALHRREVLAKKGKIKITDQILGRNEVETEINFYLAPNVEVKKADGPDFYIMDTNTNQKILLKFSDRDFAVSDALWYPEFGKQTKTKKISLKKIVSLPITFETFVEW